MALVLWPGTAVYTVMVRKVQRIAEELWSVIFLNGSCADEKIIILTSTLQSYTQHHVPLLFPLLN
jgi:hypothetical protein